MAADLAGQDLGPGGADARHGLDHGDGGDGGGEHRFPDGEEHGAPEEREAREAADVRHGGDDAEDREHHAGEHVRRRRDEDDGRHHAVGAADASAAPAGGRSSAVERVQTGVRMEKRLVKVLKALAELHDLSLGDLLEGIVLHAFAGRPPFSAGSLHRIAELERIYGLDLAARGGLHPIEAADPSPP